MAIEDTLKLILEKLDDQKEFLQLAISNLTTRKEVARFLNKSEKTIDNWVDNETFKENVHYFINEKNKIEFIPFAILEFKKAPKIQISTKTDETKKIYHSSVESITKGLKVG